MGSESFDEAVFAYFRTPPPGVELHLDGLRTALRRRLENGTVLMFNEEHWQNKRGHVPRAPDPVDMAKPFDPGRFNFNRAPDRESIVPVKLGGWYHRLVVNISPLTVGHTLVPLWAEQELPQGALGAPGVHAMFELAALSSRDDFRAVYNSLGAFASVNHLHVHGMYVAAIDGEASTDSFPIEHARRQPWARVGAVRVSRLTADAQAGPLVNGLVFEGGDWSSVAGAAGACLEMLSQLEVPHNAMVRARPTPACFLLPRQPHERFDVCRAGFNAAICEVSGFLIMQSREAYDSASSASVHDAIARGASLSSSEFESLLERLSFALGWRRCRAFASGWQPQLVVAAAAAAVGVLVLTGGLLSVTRRGRRL